MLNGVHTHAKALGALEDELRRRLYLYVRGEGRPVSREEAARATGISRKLAAFHLDKLAERGLLATSYFRPKERGGRGAGRSSKYYEPSDVEISVSIPERRYDLMGSVLLRAVRSQGSAGAARRSAFEVGRELGELERERLSLRPPGPERAIAVTKDVLERMGFEPYDDDDRVRLRSCPFDALAEEARDLVCDMNRHLVEGVVRGLGNDRVRVDLDPVVGRCCVTLRPPETNEA